MARNEKLYNTYIIIKKDTAEYNDNANERQRSVFCDNYVIV